MRGLLIALVRFYQKYLSPDQGLPYKIGLTRGGNCGFIPTCSVYAVEALEKHGAAKGGYLAVRRILRCHPWQKDHYDPVP